MNTFNTYQQYSRIGKDKEVAEFVNVNEYL